MCFIKEHEELETTYKEAIKDYNKLYREKNKEKLKSTIKNGVITTKKKSGSVLKMA